MKAKTILKNFFIKIINPKTLFIIIRIQKNKKKEKNRIYINNALKLYSKMSPGEFLHFPYFANPHILPEDISFSDIKDAGINYSNLLINHIIDKESPVLDVGCGMGELCNLLLARGYKPIGINPDRYQYSYIKKNYPDIEIINSKLEDMEYEKFKDYFGTVVTAESLQYLKLDKAFPIIGHILKPRGHWIVCDYFKKKEKITVKGQHYWDLFVNKIEKTGWKIVSQQDITQNILPFIGFCHLLTRRGLFPLLDYLIDNFKKKKPGIYFLLEDSINALRENIVKSSKQIEPEIFSQERKYMLLVMKKG